MTASTLDSLLSDFETRDLVQAQQRANHAPMVLTALSRLGAPDSRLDRYYSRLIFPQPVDGGSVHDTPITEGTWSAHLGDMRHYRGYCNYFLGRLRELGAKPLLHTHLDTVLPGLGASAYHALLRLAYAVDAGHDKEIAFALAGLAAGFIPSPDSPPLSKPASPSEILEALSGLASLRSVEPDPRSISGRFQQFYSQGDFARGLRPVRVDPLRPLDEISGLLADALARTRDFSILHGVTSCHALRLVLPYCHDVPGTVSRYWHSICAVYLAARNKGVRFDHPLPTATLSWDELKQRALASDNEHVIKLTYTCLREDENYGRRIYRDLAQREIATPSPFI